MADAKLHGPSIDDLAWLSGYSDMPEDALKQLLLQVEARQLELLKEQENTKPGSIRYRIISSKLTALKLQHVAITSTLNPKFNGRIHVGVHE